MTDTRLAYLDAQRLRLFRLQGGRCANCGRIYRRHEEMQVAHRVANSKANRAKYGQDALDHDLCKGLVCRELHGGTDCNSALLLDGKPGTAASLMREIRFRLGVRA